MNTERLLKLSGMIYKQGYFTPEQWEQKTGVNPREFPNLIRIAGNGGLCIWTAEAEQIARAHFMNVHNNWTALGIAHHTRKD